MIRRNLVEIKTGGIKPLIRKSKIIIGLITGIGFALIPLLIVRVIRPVVVIRFGQLISHRIGPYASEPSVYLGELDIGMHRDRRYLDVFYNEPSISNRQLKRMWNRTLRVVQVARPVGRLNKWVPGGEVHIIPWRSYQQRDIYGTLPDTKIRLEFTEEEERSGQRALREMGLPANSTFVCFHARDSAYGESLGVGIDIGRVDYRNSKIQNYMSAVQELTELGYYAIRMGAIVEEPIFSGNPMIIDYATRYRSEFLDIYLAAKCAYFIGSAVGITHLPMAFRRPTVHTNFVPFGVLLGWQHHDLCIPKKFWLNESERYMTFPEILNSGAGMFARSWLYNESGITLVENTAEEIRAVVLEMEERLKGVWSPYPEDDELQSKFWALFDQVEVNRAPQARIGAEFLRQNKEFI